jgi:Tat protein translocase TatB subunit
MFGIGLPELIIIMVVALVVIGPKKLPDLAKALGKGMAEFRKATEDIKESLDLEEDLEDVKGELADAIGDVNRPLEMEDLAGVEMPAYQDYDEVLEDHEEEMNKTSEEEMNKTSEEDRADSPGEDRSKDGA